MQYYKSHTQKSDRLIPVLTGNAVADRSDDLSVVVDPRAYGECPEIVTAT